MPYQHTDPATAPAILAAFLTSRNKAQFEDRIAVMDLPDEIWQKIAMPSVVTLRELASSGEDYGVVFCVASSGWYGAQCDGGLTETLTVHTRSVGYIPLTTPDFDRPGSVPVVWLNNYASENWSGETCSRLRMCYEGADLQVIPFPAYPMQPLRGSPAGVFPGVVNFSF